MVSMKWDCRIRERTLVGISLGVVRSFVLLVDNGVLGGRGTASQAGIRILGDVLVGLLGSTGTGTLDALRGLVCEVLEVKMSVVFRTMMKPARS
jgi:hypothetical protein